MEDGAEKTLRDHEDCNEGRRGRIGLCSPASSSRKLLNSTTPEQLSQYPVVRQTPRKGHGGRICRRSGELPVVDAQKGTALTEALTAVDQPHHGGSCHGEDEP